MSERRGTGEGAVYRRPDGLWVAAVELPRGLDGKRRRRIVKARTKREVLARLEQVRKHASEGVVPDPATTVAAYLCWWLDNACGQLKPATLANYRITVSRHVKPYLGAVRLAQLSPAHVRTMLTGLESAGYSANTRRLARSVLRRALGLAERDGLVARNVAALTDGPSSGRHAPGRRPRRRASSPRTGSGQRRPPGGPGRAGPHLGAAAGRSPRPAVDGRRP